MDFIQHDRALENYWRGVILFGKNVASYKFALAHALYEIDKSGSDLVTLEALALPFSQHLCRHLLNAPKQITSASSKYLAVCEKYNRGEVTLSTLQEATVRDGFNNVIDAFHNVNFAELDKRFFLDERKTHKGIRLTDNFYRLTERQQYQNLIIETEARWRLVEHAWAAGISTNLVAVEYSAEDNLLFSKVNERRVNITSCRDSINGYQKGSCFYCYRPISIKPGDSQLADVDHFIPWAGRRYVPNINGVWNLVLACKSCNSRKSSRLAEINYLERLNTRNEFFIQSKLPLHQTIVQQTGKSPAQRLAFLKANWEAVKNERAFHTWKPETEAEATF